jgi:hypothetical protein
MVSNEHDLIRSGFERRSDGVLRALSNIEIEVYLTPVDDRRYQLQINLAGNAVVCIVPKDAISVVCVGRKEATG